MCPRRPLFSSSSTSWLGSTTEPVPGALSAEKALRAALGSGREGRRGRRREAQAAQEAAAPGHTASWRQPWLEAHKLSSYKLMSSHVSCLRCNLRRGRVGLAGSSATGPWLSPTWRRHFSRRQADSSHRIRRSWCRHPFAATLLRQLCVPLLCGQAAQDELRQVRLQGLVASKLYESLTMASCGGW